MGEVVVEKRRACGKRKREGVREGGKKIGYMGDASGVVEWNAREEKMFSKR